MSTAERCPRCGSDRLTISGANGAVMTSCDRCGEQWGDVDRYYREIAEIRAEEKAKQEKAPAFSDGPGIFLPGVNPWWFR